MPLIERDAFKLGFVKRCRDEGLSDDQILSRAEHVLARLEKEAAVPPVAAPPPSSSTTHPLLANNGKLLLMAALGLPFAGGAVVGALGSKLKGNFVDEEDVKNQEVVDELRRQTELAKQNQRASRAPV